MGSSHVQGALWGVEARVWSETLEPTTRPLFEQVFDELGTGGGPTNDPRREMDRCSTCDCRVCP